MLSQKLLTIFFILLLCLLTFSLSAQAKSGKTLDASIGFETGGLLSGEQKDLFKSSLTPTPDSFYYLSVFTGVSYFPLEWLGLDVSYTFYNTVMADSSEVDQSLELFNMNYFTGGVLLKIFVGRADDSIKSYITLGGGALMTSFVRYSDDLLELIQMNRSDMYEIKTVPGYYIKGGYREYFTNNVFGEVQLKYSQVNTIVDVSNAVFNGSYLGVVIMFGYTF